MEKTTAAARQREKLTRTREDVLRELKLRARRGGPHALRSGSNRGDWLYAAAVVHCGSWGKAVEAAGFDYHELKIRPYTAREVKQQIREMAASGRRLLAFNDARLRAAAARHFGSWKGALAAAGHPDGNLLWTRDRVLTAIHNRRHRGLPLSTMAVLADDRFLYRAARSRFGSWRAALQAARGWRQPRVAWGRSKTTPAKAG
jgi:hypothetical protein